MPTNKKPNKDDIFQEREEEEEEQTINDAIPNLDTSLLLEEQEPEAFIPEFTIAPDDVPLESQVHVPSDSEQRAAQQKLYERIGLKRAKEFIEQPPQPMTHDREQFAQDSAQMIASIFSAVTMWGYSIVFGYEYGVLAPSDEQAEAIVRPIMNIITRHSKTVGYISPDYMDLKNCAKALSDYANQTIALMQQIREEKAAYGQATASQFAKSQNRTSNTNVRSNDFRGPSPNGSNDNQEAQYGASEFNGNLTADEQYQREQLSQLAQRDFLYRARRSGRI